MSYTWKDNATAVGELVDPDALNSNLMHLKYDLVGGKANTAGDTFTGPVVMSGAELDEAKSTDIASANSISLANATGNLVFITGTTTIKALGEGQAGIRREVIFSNILTLTYNATSLILPGKANITTAAGDFATFISLGYGNWACTKYVRVDGVADSGIPSGGTAGQLVAKTGSGTEWVEGVRSTALTGLSTATNAAIATTDTFLAAMGKLAARVNAIWDETDIDRIYVPVGATGISYRVGRNCTYNYCYIDCLDLAGAADSPTSLTVSVAKGGTNQFTTSAITTAAATYDNTDFNADAGDLITVTVSNTTGVAGGVMVGLKWVRR